MVKMTHAPVYFVIVQTRFNPLLALESYAPKIQDQFRLHGFPDFQVGMLATFNLAIINPTDGVAPQVPVSQLVRYTFSNMEKTAAFTLDQGSLSLQTTDYDVFESFSATYLIGLKIIHEAVSLSYTDRVGVRYLDAVFPQNGENLSDYLHNGALGLYGKLDGTLMHAFSETLVKNGPINIVARSIVQNGQIGFPPDLQPMALTIAQRFRDSTGLHAILDTDGSHENRTGFDLDHVRSVLYEVHSAVTTAFKATVTDDAIQAWG
jgi:uncharacterized protein (TIGR04255 family)